MFRRSFLKTLAVAAPAGLVRPKLAEAALPKAKITRVKIYEPPNLNRLFNQSTMICTVETDIGITGIGEGGSKDTLEQCAGTLIGKNPFRIEAIWQEMYIAWFYPPGREKIHALGALDMALWDIKGKALKLPVHELLGGAVRNHLECYGTAGLPGGPRPGEAKGTGAQAGQGQRPRMSLRERARATMEAGYRAFRMGAGDTAVGGVFNTHERVRKVAADCKEAREGVGPDGDWCIDFHQRFDYADAVRACRLIEEYEPYFVEDPVRDEHAHQDIPKLRQMTTVPLTHGEEWGQRYDFNKLVENHDIDYIRATLPNVGGITEMMKIAGMCETHAVGIIPHFTGPISTAALVNCLGTFPGPVIMEYNYAGRPIEHLPECLDFKSGKALMNDRPGLGVTAEMKLLKQIGEVTQPGRANVFYRPDGSLTHW
jgi:L-alanine-DL-glutamate epimerase-like enolase superfamily enzyme